MCGGEFGGGGQADAGAGELVNRARGYEYEGYERTIDSHIRNLRHKIETDPHAPQLIDSVTGAGYRLALTRDRQPART